MPTILDTSKTAENLVAPIDYKVGTVEEKRWKKMTNPKYLYF